ncbi:unnamed protein product [Rodentolepis nana]|uniref:Protein TSSC4 n=1 Tax=Rodentolepis nana TaxID=102285 RepID=A0A0R3T307_RODNA|nr:unnamed protein product [Rodentolepis nana]
MDSRRGACKKHDRPAIQYNPDTTGLDSRGRKLRWSGDISKIQVNLNKIFVKNAISIAPTLNIYQASSISLDCSSRDDRTDESFEDTFAKLQISKEHRRKRQKRVHKVKTSSNCHWKPTSSVQGEDADDGETESEQSTLMPSTSKLEGHCKKNDFDEDDFDRRIMFV